MVQYSEHLREVIALDHEYDHDEETNKYLDDINDRIYKLILDDGKYTVRMSEDMTVFECLRYDQKWRNLCGDNLILALVNRVQFLEEALGQKKEE